MLQPMPVLGAARLSACIGRLKPVQDACSTGTHLSDTPESCSPTKGGSVCLGLVPSGSQVMEMGQEQRATFSPHTPHVPGRCSPKAEVVGLAGRSSGLHIPVLPLAVQSRTLSVPHGLEELLENTRPAHGTAPEHRTGSTSGSWPAGHTRQK